MGNLTINGVANSSIAAAEAAGFSKVFMAYSKNASREEILEIGFNSNSGYVYIALENNVSICSCFGQQVEYLVTDLTTGEEYFFEDYDEAAAMNSMF